MIAAEDEATFGLLPTVVRGWAKKGSQPTAKLDYKYDRIHVFGARSTKTFVAQFSTKTNQRTYVKFLDKLLKRWGRVCLFVDNAPWHKGKILEGFKARHTKTLVILRFPKYAPELNPVEPCWKPARRKIGNRLLHTLPTMTYHLRKVFNNPKT
ncbi:MAG: transposase, partial [Candidatus Altiarchaeota archaeon]